MIHEDPKVEEPERANIFESGVVLGSTSTHKLEALREACVRVGLNVEIAGFTAESEVSAQPYGFDETYQGAMNRAKSTQAETPSAVIVGIENGIIPIGDTFLELAVVVILTPDGRSFLGTSAGIEFPREAVEEARRRGFETTTAGDIIAETIGGSTTDPHAALTNGRISRKAILTEAIVSVLLRVLSV